MDDLETLRTLLESERPVRWSVGDPAPVRARVAAYVSARRDAGATCNAISSALGISRRCVQTWGSEQTPLKLVPVEVIEPDEPPAIGPTKIACTAPSLRPILVSPRGYRVEGLTLAALAELLASLG